MLEMKTLFPSGFVSMVNSLIAVSFTYLKVNKHCNNINKTFKCINVTLNNEFTIKKYYLFTVIWLLTRVSEYNLMGLS
jgi:uncharacterized membrane protein